VTEFKQRHPSVEIDLIISDSGTVYDETQRGKNDFAVVIAAEPPFGLHAEVLCYEPLVLFTSPRHPLARAGRVTMEALAQEPFVCAPVGDGRPQLIESMFQRLGFSRRLVMTVGHPEGIKEAVRQGIGVAMLFRCAVRRELATGELAEIAIEGHALAHPFLLLHTDRKRFSPVQRRLIEFMRERVPEVSSPPQFV
jgi:DNA-binding transcriptional LysR family regulator